MDRETIRLNIEDLGAIVSRMEEALYSTEDSDDPEDMDFASDSIARAAEEARSLLWIIQEAC